MRDFDLQPVIVNSILSFATYKRYYLFCFFRGRFYQLKKWGFFIAIPLIVLGACLLTSQNAVIIFIAIFLMMVYFFVIVSMWISPRRCYKNSPAIFENKICYQFRKHEMLLSHRGNVAKGQSQISYQAIYKVYERPEVFYLFISTNQAYLIEKSDFDNDSPGTLRYLLQSALPAKKYCICG